MNQQQEFSELIALNFDEPSNDTLTSSKDKPSDTNTYEEGIDELVSQIRNFNINKRKQEQNTDLYFSFKYLNSEHKD
jgi:hypothetical protein